MSSYEGAPESRSKRLCVGVALTREPVETRAKLDAFCKALADATGLPVTGQGVWRYERLLDAMDAGDIDIAWLPPVVALRAIGRRRVLPIALPLRNGAASYSTALFSRPDSRFQRIEDLSGARAAWVDRQSAAGYLIIRAYLRSRGVDLSRAFSAEHVLGGHDAVAQAVHDGKADVGATFAYFEPSRGPELIVRHAGWGSRDMHIIAHAGPIPSDVLASSVSMPVAISRAVQRALTGGENRALKDAAGALLGADGFVIPESEHLEPLTALMSSEPTP